MREYFIVYLDRVFYVLDIIFFFNLLYLGGIYYILRMFLSI